MWVFFCLLHNFDCCTFAPSCGLFSSHMTENLKEKNMAQKKTSKQYKQDANYTSHIRIRNLVEGILSTHPPNLTPHYRRTETHVVCNSSVIFGILSLWRFRHSSFSLSFYLTATDKEVKLDQERLLHRGNKKLGLRLFSESRESLLSKHRPQKSAPQHLAQPQKQDLK